MQKVITRGREPGLMLTTHTGEATLAETGKSLLTQMRMTAELMDHLHKTQSYSASVNDQMEKLEDASLTPSAQVLQSLQSKELDYTQWILLKSREHKNSFARSSTNKTVLQNLTRKAAESLNKQQQIEAGDTIDFDLFLKEYLVEQKHD